MNDHKWRQKEIEPQLEIVQTDDKRGHIPALIPKRRICESRPRAPKRTTRRGR
jgi:hypothetical protein